MGKTIKILLVEDEAMLAMMLKKNLELKGYEVSGPVASGEAAIQEAAEELPNAVLMDIGLLGKMDGVEAAKKISETCDVAIIFMTGYSNEDVKVRAQALHPAAFLVKPVTPDDIEPVLLNILSKQRT